MRVYCRTLGGISEYFLYRFSGHHVLPAFPTHVFQKKTHRYALEVSDTAPDFGDRNRGFG
jgi:hypothetical protein